MEAFFTFWLVSVIFLGPVLYLLFYAHEIFGLPKLTILVYLLGLALGFLVWKPLVLITLIITWSLILLSWVILIWNILRYKS